MPMNPQDLELFEALSLRQQQLESAVADLRADLQALVARLAEPDATPPIPAAPEPEPAPVAPPPLPLAAAAPPLPPLPPMAQEAAPESIPAGPGFEIQFGRWLARIGVVFLLLTLIFTSIVAYEKFHQYVGPWSKLALFALVSAGFVAGGLWLERKSRDLVVYGRTLAGGGLACLYYTLYGATYVPQLQVVHNAYLGGILLLAWSAGVLWLAERRKSELLSIFAISLAYFSSAITPVGDFTMAADLLLAVTAVVFLVRNAWTGLSYLCLLGTYLGFVRQIVTGTPDLISGFALVHDPASFWPWAIYLTGAWLIFTAGIFLANAPNFDGAKRLAFLSLNNGAWAGLLIVAALLSGHGHIGGLLLILGAVQLGACLLARQRWPESRDIANAYLVQGLAIGTAGVTVAYHGVTRGVLLTAESVSLAAAGAWSRNPVLRLGAIGASLLGTAFLLGETILTTPFPSWLMAFGTAAMIANTCLEQFSRQSPSTSSRLALTVYIGLALALVVRWIYGVMPTDEITVTLLALATALVATGLPASASSLIRAGFVLDLVGSANYLLGSNFLVAPSFTWLDATACALFLAQPGLLRHWGRELISEAESWLVVLISSAMAWLFISNSMVAANSPNLTLAWALLALALIVIGFAAGERRQRWCGLGVLVAAFARVAVHDFWGFSDVGKVITFFALTVICLGLSFLYYKFADRLKEWL